MVPGTSIRFVFEGLISRRRWRTAQNVMIRMRGALRSPARQWLRIFVALFVSLVLPYSSTRCFATVETNCPVANSGRDVARPVGHEAVGTAAHLGHEHHGGNETGQPEHRTCCDLTGKDRFSFDPIPAPAAPVLIVVATISEGRPRHRAADLGKAPSVIASAHAPPRYLRFESLLI